MEFEFICNEKEYKISIECKDNKYLVNFEDKKLKVDYSYISSNCLSILLGDKSFVAYLIENEGKKFVYLNGREFYFSEKETVGATPRVAPTMHPGEAMVSSPMPGTVVKINVSEGETVEHNQTVVIVEAMKMENELKSPFKGVVRKVNTVVGKLINAGEALVELEAVGATQRVAPTSEQRSNL
ncbi:MAG: acetyl-CoA carboxylase biotin carboxyl carrier protein subunit [Candidatus Edwardsbacteria bacterium]